MSSVSNSNVHPTASIEAEELHLGANVKIGANVSIKARVLKIGEGSRIEERTQINSLRGGMAERIEIGEQTIIGQDCKVALPELHMGDYVNIHNHGLLNGGAPMVLGHNCWVGQNCLLNSDSPLWIGNNVGIGAYSCVYTHAYFGDLLEGCTLFKSAPVTIEDDAWIVGSYNVISPGITLGPKSVILTGSLVTKSVEPEGLVGGSPAKPMGRSVYVRRSLEEKLQMMGQFVEEFIHSNNFAAQSEPNAWVFPQEDFTIWLDTQPQSLKTRHQLGIARGCSMIPDYSLIDLGKRQYHRTRHPMEIRFLRFLKSYRAKFVPADNPVVGQSLRST